VTVPRRSAAPWWGAAALVLVATACADATRESPPEDDLALSGGAATVFLSSSGAFAAPAPNLSGESLDRHRAGDAAFEVNFVTSPAPVHGGLGPIFNNVSCSACHPLDGRGRPPEPGEALTSALLRISVAGADAHGGPLAVPGYGTQLQTRAIVGAEAEAEVAVAYEPVAGQFADGQAYELRRPVYTIGGGYSALPGGLLVSTRTAPAVFGLGLLEAVSEATLRGLADPTDADGDGISGRVNEVWDVETGARRVGRFGWKAGVPTLFQQTATAYLEDIGITSPTFPAESCAGQSDGCADHAPDVDDETQRLVTHYIRTLGVPARRNLDDAVARRGAALFRQAGCAGCHLPELRTATLAGVPEVSDQTIRPYTDLLLHDMGSELADDRPEFDASGREWRTAPLWGIGLTEVVSGHANFLHDGRAGTLMEAILWHGGEAEAAREAVRGFAGADREALLAFLRSL
jgi:CxxC motif-containing protein (DUF1111 family)